MNLFIISTLETKLISIALSLLLTVVITKKDRLTEGNAVDDISIYCANYLRIFKRNLYLPNSNIELVVKINLLVMI